LFLIASGFITTAYSQNLRIYQIDVEQADATLLVSPSGGTLLVDSGKNGHGNRLKAAMDEAGVTQIDAFVCTHYHEDHYGGIDDLVNDHDVPVLETYDRGEKNYIPASKRNSTTFLGYNNAVGEDAIILRPGDEIIFDPEIRVTCISSSGVVIGEENPTAGVDENDMSISLLITYGSFRYFIGGDIEHETEEDIASRDLIMDIDVYQANHHGSHSSSLREFMEDLSPTVIVISNGSHGTYHHPRQTTLDLYSLLAGPPIVFQTNRCLAGSPAGNVQNDRIGDPESTDDDGTILIDVDNDVGTYTVSLRESVYETYQIKGGGGPNISVVIESILPNPQGQDRQFEEVTIRNNGAQAVSVAGWILRDRSNKDWDLSSMGSLAASQSGTIRRNGQRMSLNNSGDEIRLQDATGVERDRFEYSGSQEGVVINTEH